MKKLFRTMLCAALLAVAVSIPAFAAQTEAPAKQGDFYVLVNGEYVTFTDAVPQIKNDRSCLPFVAVFEQLGFAEKDMTWNGDTKTVTAVKDDLTIALTIGKQEITLTKNGTTSTLATDVAPYIDPSLSRTYIPFGLVADALGYHVGWDAEQKAVIIDDVDAILAANNETYTLMDQYLDYSRSFASQNQKVTGSYAFDLNLNSAYEGTDSSMGASVTGKYEMLMADNSAFQFDTDMLLAVTATENGEDAMDQLMTPEEQAMFPMDIDLAMRGDITDGIYYFQSAALTKLLDQPEMANAWFKLDAGAMFDQMSDMLGMDYAALMDLSMSSMEQSFADTLADMMQVMPLTSVETTTSDYLTQINALCADSAFQKSGSSYVSSVEEDGVSMTLTLYTSGSKVNGCEVSVAALDPEQGIAMEIAATMKNKKMEMGMSMDMNMGDILSLTMEMIMDGTYQSTSAKPVTQPPTNATVIDLTQMLGGV